MIATSTNTILDKQNITNDTVDFVDETNKTKWQNITDIEDRLVLPNLDEHKLSQTRIEHFNGESFSLDIKVPELLINPPRLPQARESFHVKQKWEGYVLEVGEETFLARLIPIVGEYTDLEAEIYLEDVELPDRKLVEPGAIFYWSIGYLVKPSGNRCRASLIRFRRLPPWTKGKIKMARKRASQLMNLLDDE